MSFLAVDTSILWGGLGFCLGLLIFVAYWLYIRSSDRTSEKIITEAQKQAETIRKESEIGAKAEAAKVREKAVEEIQAERRELLNTEKNLTKKEDSLNRKLDLLNKKEHHLVEREKGLAKRGQPIELQEQEVDRLIEEEKQVLYRITELSKEDAEKLLLQKLEKDFEHEKETLISRTVDRIKETSETRAKEILATCMQRMASSYCQEITTS